MSEQQDKKTEIHHIAIAVADIKRSIKWYMTSFHCELLEESAREAVLQFANIRLVLVLPSQEPAHMGFLKSDAHTFGELRPRGGDLWSTFVADPTGNVVELIGVDPAQRDASIASKPE